MIPNTLKFIWNHPLSRGRRVSAYGDWLCWQIGCRLLRGAVVMPFVDDSVLLVEPGMTGATGNLYVGLAEFEEMAFLLHFLDENDLFVEAGANVGAYTVLASACSGAKSISIEAVPSTFRKLRRNIVINEIADKVESHNCALGENSGALHFSSGFDAMNHVLPEREGGVVVAARTLDEVCDGRVPKLMKIDVEGYETAVIKGGQKILSSKEQVAVIMELNGLGRRYGYEDQVLHEQMEANGYSVMAYAPRTRRLEKSAPVWNGNVIYVRSEFIGDVQERLRNSPAYSVKGMKL